MTRKRKKNGIPMRKNNDVRTRDPAHKSAISEYRTVMPPLG